MMSTPQNLRLYYWVPRTEVAFIQSVIDAYEGLARLRTERHEGERSLLMCLVQESREKEFRDVMRHLQNEIIGETISI
jgi:hypothetical protein